MASAATAAPPAPTENATEKKPTEYSAFRRVVGNRDALVKAIVDEVGDDTGTILIFIGTATTNKQPGPKNAMEAVGEHRDLDGDYAIAASNGVKVFPGLKTKVKRGIEGL